LLRTPRQHNMYSIDLNNVVPHKDLTFLVAKASADECMLWHMRLGHLNLKTMNKLVRHNLVRGLPSKCFENDHACVACLKESSIRLFAEAGNTACYVQNRVLVNKSQNKTPYELFNGRTPAIGFLKPFGCYIMILNTLDHIGKFEAKGDEGYFIGYSMSSKAFRIFNKRTKRVEENLHVDFLENKLIEKGAGPNWLFDIDTLTNSMNYVLVVVAESSTSNAQDTCNVDAPESSGNSNPTATSINPLADQMETLTVETLIPTVSSPVPTACLNNSPQISSDSRLISKRVTSQNDTPSLDNILTLTNMFEDILRVTTNSYDSNGVEADLGNMENNISASPTPTFKIHKDHPKSQIIGPVDTPVQTRTKSKEMEEQSFIATINQKTDPTLLQFCLFSCFLSQKEPKKISDALKDPSWVEAMQEELLQFKIQNVWTG
nr:putative ribonuclease H-like domain-containing protein [Tanacetum cinerariifolium]